MLPCYVLQVRMLFWLAGSPTQCYCLVNLRNKIIRTQRTKKFPYKHRKRNGSHSHIIVHLYTKLPIYSKNTNLIISFRTHNTMYNQIYNKSPQNKMNSSGIYRLQCKTCKKSYVGQTERSIEIRHGEHVRYIKTNNSLSAYALHILNNRQEYGNSEHTIQLLQACAKGK